MHINIRHVTEISESAFVNKTMNKENVRVGVIGAGLAGLAAASRLFESGFREVVVFEAASKAGGRIRSEKINGQYLELGPQWIHGEGDNVALDIAMKLNLVDDPDQERLEDIGEDFVEVNSGRFFDEDEIDFYELFEPIEENADDYKAKPFEVK